MTSSDSIIKSTAYEEERLKVLHALDLLDKGQSEAFDDITRTAAICLKIPTVLISLVDRHRQQFISKCGMEARETPREQSVCAHAILQSDIFEIADLTKDPRFINNPLVVNPPHLRFYAGVPLILESGHAIGTLCIIDYIPRVLTEEEKNLLYVFARMVMNQISLRRSIGRRNGLTNLNNLAQFEEDIHDLQIIFPEEKRIIILVEVFEPVKANEMAQAMGMRPIETLVRNSAYRLSMLTKDIGKVYHIERTRFLCIFDDEKIIIDDDYLTKFCDHLEHIIIEDDIPLKPVIRAGIIPLNLNKESIKDVIRKSISVVNTAIYDDQRWVYYNLIKDQKTQRTYRLAGDLKKALEESQFYLLYQPRLDMSTNKIISAEALIRWHHPEIGPIFPDEFIPIIERTAIMQNVTFWVIDEAASQIKKWQNLLPNFRVSVNLSPRDFDNERLVEYLRSICLKYDIPSSLLEVEVTEGEGIKVPVSVIKQLTQIRELGIDVAIDDFGSGYSNFSYIQKLPANIVKIDQSLIRDVSKNLRHQKVVRTILELAIELGYCAVAEGVEDMETLDLLKSWACPQIQGYYIARPMKPELLPSFIKEFNIKSSNA